MTHDIVVIDDEVDIRDLLSGILTDEGYFVRTANDGESAISVIKERKPSLVILDVWLGNHEHDGFRILKFIKENYPYVPVIMISGHGTIETAVNAIKKGAYDFLEKPFQTDRLLIIVKRAIETASLKRENDELKVSAQGRLIGSSQEINSVKTKLDKILKSNTRVFIKSPIGFNRQIIAKEIHEKSKRFEGPFVVVSCNALKSHLEIELFGCEISSTEASGQRKKLGAIEKAHTGTLFLDQIDCISKELQFKIIKFLQEQTFCSLGSTKKTSVDVRVIAGTSNSNYKDLLNDELLSRLSMTSIEIPSLSQRVQDIPDLVNYWVSDFSQSLRKPYPIKIDPEALILMQSYSWPGDLEQLRNVIESLVLLNTDGVIKKEDLPLDMIEGNSFVSEWQKKTAEIVVLPLREAREMFEKEYLSAQVHRFAGNISRTAKFVGMERSALHRKLRTLGFYDEKDEDIEI